MAKRNNRERNPSLNAGRRKAGTAPKSPEAKAGGTVVAGPSDSEARRRERERDEAMGKAPAGGVVGEEEDPVNPKAPPGGTVGPTGGGQVTSTTETPDEDEDEDTGEGDGGGPTEETTAQKNLRAELQQILEMFGLNTPGNIALIQQAVREDWSATKFTQELRQSADYLANPLFKANVERAKQGNDFKTEAEVIKYASDFRDTAARFGYKIPTNDKIAASLLRGKSADEFAYQLQVEQRIKTFGGGVALRWKEYTGDDPSDEELHAVFNKEINTAEFEKFARRSEARGRPMVFGLNVTEEQAAELERLGFTPDTAQERWRQLAGALPTVARLAALDKGIADDPDNPFDSVGTLFADIFRSDPNAAQSILQMTAREQARFKRGGAPVAVQGQLAGLLSGREKETYR